MHKFCTDFLLFSCRSKNHDSLFNTLLQVFSQVFVSKFLRPVIELPLPMRFVGFYIPYAHHKIGAARITHELRKCSGLRGTPI